MVDFVIGTGKGEFATFGHGVQANKDAIKELLDIKGPVSLWGEDGLAAQYARHLESKNSEAKLFPFEENGVPSKVHTTIPDGTNMAGLIEHSIKVTKPETRETEEPKRKGFFGRVWDGIKNVAKKVGNFLVKSTNPIHICTLATLPKKDLQTTI